jgi:hypothetical protein
MNENHGWPVSQNGYVRTFDRDSARRQFKLSVWLVAAMAVAAFALGFLYDPTRGVQASSAPTTIVQ